MYKPERLISYYEVWLQAERALQGPRQDMSSNELPDGVWPTMITPFLDDEKKSIDWNGLDCALYFSLNILGKTIAMLPVFKFMQTDS